MRAGQRPHSVQSIVIPRLATDYKSVKGCSRSARLQHRRDCLSCQAVSSNGVTHVNQQLRDWHDVDHPRIWQVRPSAVSPRSDPLQPSFPDRAAAACIMTSILEQCSWREQLNRLQGTEEDALNRQSPLQQLPAPWKVSYTSPLRQSLTAVPIDSCKRQLCLHGTAENVAVADS